MGNDKKSKQTFILLAICILLILVIMFLIINKLTNNGGGNGNSNEIPEPVPNYSGEIKGQDNSSINVGDYKIELVQKVDVSDPISVGSNKESAVLVAENIDFVDINNKSYVESSVDYENMVDTEIKVSNNVIDVVLIPNQWEINDNYDFIQYRLSEFGNINTVLYNSFNEGEARITIYVVTDKKEIYRCLIFPKGNKEIQITRLNIDNVSSVSMIDGLDPDEVKDFNPSIIIKTEDNKYYTDYSKTSINELDI
jgi:hypothetical protein